MAKKAAEIRKTSTFIYLKNKNFNIIVFIKQGKMAKKSRGSGYSYSQGFIREPLSQEEMQKLRDAFQEFREKDTLKYRNKEGEVVWKRKLDPHFTQMVFTAFLIMYDAAARYKEALRVKKKSIDEEGWIYIDREKRGDSGWVPVTQECIDACQKLIEMNEKEKGETEWLFPSQKGDHYSSNIIYIAIKELVKIAGIRNVVSPHYLRHTKATEMADSGEDPLTIKYQMGSKYVDSIMPYIWRAKKKKRLQRYKEKLDEEKD